MGSPSHVDQLLAGHCIQHEKATHGDWWLRHFPCLQFHFLGWHTLAGGGGGGDGVVAAGGMATLGAGGCMGGGEEIAFGGVAAAFGGVAGGGVASPAGGVPFASGGVRGGGVAAAAGGGRAAAAWGGGVATLGADGIFGGAETALGGGGAQLQMTGTCLGKIHARQPCCDRQEAKRLCLCPQPDCQTAVHAARSVKHVGFHLCPCGALLPLALVYASTCWVVRCVQYAVLQHYT